MKYYSTKKSVPEVDLKHAVTKGLADDNGLFMPERIEKFEPSFFDSIHNLSFQEISFEVAKKFFGEDVVVATMQVNRWLFAVVNQFASRIGHFDHQSNGSVFFNFHGCKSGEGLTIQPSILAATSAG